MSYVRSIPVRDANGDELTVYEFRDRRFLGGARRLKLCTGELVERRDGQLVIADTGESLAQIDNG